MGTAYDVVGCVVGAKPADNSIGEEYMSKVCSAANVVGRPADDTTYTDSLMYCRTAMLS